MRLSKLPSRAAPAERTSRVSERPARTALEDLRPADLAKPAAARARAQLAAVLEALAALPRTASVRASAEVVRLRGRRAELTTLCGAHALRVYAAVLLDVARGRPVDPARSRALDRRLGLETPRDPLTTALRAFRVADGRDEIPPEEPLARVLALAAQARR